MKITRRHFLITSYRTLLCSSLGLSLGLGFIQMVLKKDANCLEPLLDFFQDKYSARVIGSEYLKQRRKNLNLEHLMHELPPHLITNDSLFNKNRFSRQVEECIRKDFEGQRIINLHGWILSKTEVTICAIASLNFSKPPLSLANST